MDVGPFSHYFVEFSGLFLFEKITNALAYIQWDFILCWWNVQTGNINSTRALAGFFLFLISLLFIVEEKMWGHIKLWTSILIFNINKSLNNEQNPSQSVRKSRSTVFVWVENLQYTTGFVLWENRLLWTQFCVWQMSFGRRYLVYVQCMSGNACWDLFEILPFGYVCCQLHLVLRQSSTMQLCTLMTDDCVADHIKCTLLNAWLIQGVSEQSCACETVQLFNHERYRRTHTHVWGITYLFTRVRHCI